MIIDGKKIARELRHSLRSRIASLQAEDITPRLEVILIGQHPSSLIYVDMKQRAAHEIGIECTINRLPETVSQAEVMALIQKLNNPDVHGILLQLPIPAHLDTKELLNAIDYTRDVDGLNAVNVGRRIAHLPGLLPCTPKGCIKLIKSVREDLSGLTAVVVGRSDLVGKPMAELLIRENCTVTQVHKETKNPQEICCKADILVVAIGVPRHVKANWVKPGAIVIDVGITREGAHVVGDVDFSNVKNIAGAITPVPGGVGPMTVACLLENVVEAAEGLSV